jgi:predicted RNase H-like nuclease (RuvC/YqgF family)
MDLLTLLATSGVFAAALAATWQIVGFIVDAIKAKMEASQKERVEDRGDRTLAFEQAERIIERYNNELDALKAALADQRIDFEMKLAEQEDRLREEITLLRQESVQLNTQNAKLVSEITELKNKLLSALAQIEELKAYILELKNSVTVFNGE